MPNQPNHDLIIIGRVIDAHGIKGNLKVQPLSDNPALFHVGLKLYYYSEDSNFTAKIITAIIEADSYLLVQLEGIVDRTEAEALKGKLLHIYLDDLPELSQGAYYCHQIIGLEVVNTSGDSLGVVVDVLFNFAHDQYVVERSDGKRFWLPAVKQFIKTIDLANAKIIVDPPEGLVDLV